MPAGISAMDEGCTYTDRIGPDADGPNGAAAIFDFGPPAFDAAAGLD